MTWLKLLFVGGVLGAFSFAGAMIAGGFGSTETPRESDGFADQFCRAATNLGHSNRWPVSHKQELLRAAARQRQASQAGTSGLYWNEFQKVLTNSDDKQEGLERETDHLIQVVAFQDQLEESMVRATNVGDFDRAWEVWEQVSRQVVASRDKVLHGLSVLIESIPKPTKASRLDEVATCYLEFVDQLKASHIPLTAVIAATPPAEPLPDELQQALPVIRGWQERVKATAQETQKAINEHKRQLRESTVKIDPSRTDKGRFADGQFTAWIAQIAELELALERSDLGAWQDLQAITKKAIPRESTSLTKTPVTPPAENEPTATLVNAAQDAGAARVLAYNLWALREIHAAETADSWVPRLAQIDTGMLDPVVSALYTSVYSRRLEAITSPDGRSNTVQQLLSGNKVPSSAF